MFFVLPSASPRRKPLSPPRRRSPPPIRRGADSSRRRPKSLYAFAIERSCLEDLNMHNSNGSSISYNHTNAKTVVAVSKTFTTAETMLYARTLRQWITASLGVLSGLIIDLSGFPNWHNRA
ncbi:Glucose-6-phosphate isomerase, cytosolic [Ananas comosus]|uniref:Glucose-6-phosphate isomerase, cytosolic n=1 Tax=Ananas comosus TaxID=4615 RepID=A0A199W9K1_ANACO|nr:Glucose-6-phosphate isomerase, cytosolic [Ananas comosus]